MTERETLEASKSHGVAGGFPQWLLACLSANRGVSGIVDQPGIGTYSLGPESSDIIN